MKSIQFKTIAKVVCIAFFISPVSCFHALPNRVNTSTYKTSCKSSSGTDDIPTKDAPVQQQTPRFGTKNPLRLAVLKLGFTEPAWSSPLNYQKKEGIYICANCKSPLFDHKGKYD